MKQVMGSVRSEREPCLLIFQGRQPAQDYITQMERIQADSDRNRQRDVQNNN
jgi:hypothetical protein